LNLFFKILYNKSSLIYGLLVYWTSYDFFSKKPSAISQRKILGFYLCSVSGLIILFKSALAVSFFIDPKNTFLNNQFITKEFLANNYQENSGNNTNPLDDSSNFTSTTYILLETILDLLIFVNSIFTLFIYNTCNSESKSSNHENNLSNLEMQNILLTQKIYTDYKFLKIEKTYFYILQFCLISFVIIFNVSIANLQNFLIFSCMIIFAVFQSYKYLDIFNKVFSFFGFAALALHYIKNVPELKNNRYDNIIGVANFNSNYSIVFFTFFYISYMNSCNMQKYSLNETEIKIIKTHPDHQTLKEEFNNKNFIGMKFFRNLKKYTLNISSICYNVILLFWILFHVCILMFFNFLFLFFGLNKKKDSLDYKKWFLIPSFILSLLFTTLQYVFNMSGVFMFNNIKVFKWLEIIGVYKYYKAKVSSDYSNLKTLDQSNEEKIKGMLTDVILLLLIMIFACALMTEKKERKENFSENVSQSQRSIGLESNNNNNNMNSNQNISQNQNQNSSDFIINYIVEKSFIICLLVLFACSIVKFDLLHCVYFTFFVILTFVKESSFKKVWDFALLINSFIIIILLYFWNILAVNFLGLEKETNPMNQDVFTYLGLKINKNSIFFLDYWEHICLYLFGFIHNYITSLYKEKVELDNLFKFPEWSRMISFVLSILLMVLLATIKPLSFQGLLLLSFCLIFFCAQLFLLSEGKYKIIKIFIKILLLLSVALVIMKYSINFSFFVNYLKNNLNLDDDISRAFNYRREEMGNSLGNMNGNNYSREDTLPNDSDEARLKYFSLQDFGLDAMNLTLKLMINAIIVILAKILSAYEVYGKNENSQNQGNNNISHDYSEANAHPQVNNNFLRNFNFSINDTHIQIDVIFTYIKVFIYQVIYLHSTKLMFLLSVFICVHLESMIGVIIFGVLLSSLFLELRTGWKYSFFPLVLLSIIVMCFIYVCNLNAFLKWMTKDYEWFGLYNPRTEGYILYDLTPYLVILFSAFITRISSGFSQYYKEENMNLRASNVIQENNDKKLSEENLSESKNLGSLIMEDVSDKNNSSNSCDEKNRLLRDSDMPFSHNEKIKQINEKEKEKLSNSIDLTQNSYLNMNCSTLSAIVIHKSEEEAINSLSTLWSNFDYFWYLYGFYIVLITIMLVAFIKVNVLSLIFMTFVGFQSFGIYLRTEYLTEKEEQNSRNLRRIKSTWMVFATFLAVFTFLQYINFMWFPPSWKITKPWEHLSFFCSKEGKTIYSPKTHFKNLSDFEYCVADWKAWLNIDNYSTKDIFYNFICLFLLLISHKYFTTREIFKRERYDESKVIDFTITENRKDFYATIRYFLFIYLKSFILFYIIIISIIYSYRYTNLIYGGFMFISFYLLFKDTALVKQKNDLWKYVQYYNYLVLVFFMLFQTPFLPCPVNRDGRSFIGLEECVEEENRLYQSYLLYEYPKNKVDALYMVMVQTIGVLKLDFKLLIVGNLSLFMIYIVALIQQIIFEHPYQSIVDNYYYREKQINCKSRAFKIVQDSHLNIHTEYRQLFTFMEILKGKLERLGKKIITYGDLWTPSFGFKNYYRQGTKDSEEREKLKKDNYNSNSSRDKDENNLFKDEIEVMVDELFSNDKHLAGLLDYKVVKQTVEKIRKEKVKQFLQKMKEKRECPDDNMNLSIKIDNLNNVKDMNDQNILSQNNFNNNEEINLFNNKPLTDAEKDESEKKLKNEILEELIYELKNLFAEQYVKDKLHLYMHKDHGLHIAREIFQKMVLEETQNPLIISSTKKDIELLKKLFVQNGVSGSVVRKPIQDRVNIHDGKSEFKLLDEKSEVECNLLDQKEKVENKEKTENIEKNEKSENEELKNEEICNVENINIKETPITPRTPTANQRETFISQNTFERDINNNTYRNKEHQIYLHTDPQYHAYIKRLSFKPKNAPEENDFSYYRWFKKQLWRSIDKVLLIDLTSSRKTKVTNILELLIFSFYTNIEFFIVIAFIINHCIDASIMSMVYPISYFGYGLVEYPFTNKYYWKIMIVYSLITITLKLVYQFPFFCGYPFLAVFNIFEDNYCEYVPLTDQEISEGFEFIIGLRKYNGEYSYPKNAGLLSGILWDIIILCLLLVMRSLLKSKGIWNFVNINSEFSKVPAFEANKINGNTNTNENTSGMVLTHTENQNNQNNSQLNNQSSNTFEQTIKTFLARLVPELFPKDNTIIYKPGVDYYPLSFATMLVILIYTLFFFGSLTGKSSQGIQDALDKQQFSKDLVWTVLILITIIVIDRIIYKLRSINNEFIFEKFKKIEENQMKEVMRSGVIKKDQKVDLISEGNVSCNNLSNSNDRNVSFPEHSAHYIEREREREREREINIPNVQNGPNVPVQETLPVNNPTQSNQNPNAELKDHIETSNMALMIKLGMHYTLLIFAHILIFFVIPLSTRISFFNNTSLIVLYLICCVYFYLSSKQIKYGFPLATKGQYFADSTQLSNRILFKVYRNVPFLYELRAILDWTITKTSLDLFQFFKMECAYANLYEVKCDMDMRKMRRNGEDRWWFEKVSWGLCSFLFLMFILILPMILFSSFNPNLVENKVLGGNFKITLELKSPEYPFVTTYNLNLFDVSTLKINSLKEPEHYDYIKTYLLSQIDDLEERKIQKVKVVNYSQLDWILSPPAINHLLKHLEKKTDCFINIEWEFRREYPMNNKGIMGDRSIKLNREQIATLRNIIFALKNHQKPEKFSLEIKDAFPKVIRLSNRQWKYLKFDPKHKTPHKENTDLQIQLIKENERDIYWKIHQVDIRDTKNCK
jgi:hypothetical protein